MKKERNVQEEVDNQKYHKPNPVGYFLYYFIVGFLQGRFKYHNKMHKKDKIGKGAAFVLFNHLSRRDHIFVCDAVWPRRMNMVAGYAEHFRGHLHKVFKFNQILPLFEIIQ